jgi:hypothetical protein
MFDPKSHFHLPLDASHVLVLLPRVSVGDGDNKQISRTTLENDSSSMQTAYNNIRQVENAERYIIGSKSAIEATHYEMDNFNSDEFESKAKKLLNRLNAAR